jgi:amidase
MTASEIAAAIRDGKVRATDVVDAHLERIERRNPGTNAIVTLDAERAQQAARQVDLARTRGDALGPLAGVPITLKDCHATAGVRTTVGHPPLAEHVPTSDGTVAARLRAAGAILLGKTNVPPLLAGPYTDNPIFGRTANPWNVAHTPGGSSGGSAAAVADRMSPLDIGSDAVGSVRMPAHFCGVLGFKPSERRVSLVGHHCFGDLPDAPRGWRSICTAGPIARSVADLELAFEILAGPDGRDTELAPLPVQRQPTPALASLRIAFARTLPGVPVSREVGDAVESLADELARAGANVQERVPVLEWDAAFATMWMLLQATGSAMTPLAVEPPQARIVAYTKLLAERDAIILALDEFMQHFDVLLCPPCISTAFVHGTGRERFAVDDAMVDHRQYAHHCGLFNTSGQPAIVLPYRVSTAGLPIGVQLVGRRWYDERLLAIARAIEPITGPCPQPP